jgi:hypothetical protein
MCRRVRRLEAAALVDRDVDDHRTRLHPFHHRRRDKLRRVGARDQHAADDEIRRGHMLLEGVVRREHGVERTSELAP